MPMHRFGLQDGESSKQRWIGLGNKGKREGISVAGRIQKEYPYSSEEL
jgi:hypothetical protein